MITLNDLNNAYIDLYSALREYIWDISTIELLAELETATYNRFADLDKVRHLFHNLKICISSTDVYKDDKELQDAVKTFESALDTDNSIVYSPIISIDPLYDEEDKPIYNTEKEEIDDGYQDHEVEEEGDSSIMQNQEDSKRVFNIEYISQSSTN